MTAREAVARRGRRKEMETTATTKTCTRDLLEETKVGVAATSADGILLLARPIETIKAKKDARATLPRKRRNAAISTVVKKMVCHQIKTRNCLKRRKRMDATKMLHMKPQSMPSIFKHLCLGVTRQCRANHLSEPFVQLPCYKMATSCIHVFCKI
jgi:hypothetical protein